MTVPRKLAYRIWAACLAEQARCLRALTSDQSLRRARRRGGAAGTEGAEAKADGRLRMAAALERDAAVVSRWIGEPARCRGGDVPYETVAMVCAAIYQHGSARTLLAERVDLAGLDAWDYAGLIRRVLGDDHAHA